MCKSIQFAKFFACFFAAVFHAVFEAKARRRLKMNWKHKGRTINKVILVCPAGLTLCVKPSYRLLKMMSKVKCFCADNSKVQVNKPMLMLLNISWKAASSTEGFSFCTSSQGSYILFLAHAYIAYNGHVYICLRKNMLLIFLRIYSETISISLISQIFPGDNFTPDHVAGTRLKWQCQNGCFFITD